MSKQQPSQPECAAPQNTHQQNMALMKELGATSYNPIPPDQHNWQAEQPDVACEVKLWSWMVQHTVAFLPGRERSTYAVDEHGSELHIEDAAAGLGWDPGNARRNWRRLKARGVVRNGTPEEGKRRLYLCGKVNPVNHLDEILTEIEEFIDEGEQPAKPEKGHKGLYAEFSPYLRLQLKRMRPADRTAFLARWESKETWAKQVAADVMEAARTITEQVEDSIFAEFRLHKTRITRRDEKRGEKDAERQARLKPLIEEVKKYVQTSFAFEAKEVCTVTKNGPVQTAASLLNTEKNQSTDKETPAPGGGGGFSSRSAPPPQGSNKLPAPALNGKPKPSAPSPADSTQDETDVTALLQQYRTAAAGKDIDPPDRALVLEVLRIVRTAGRTVDDLERYLQDRLDRDVERWEALRRKRKLRPGDDPIAGYGYFLKLIRDDIEASVGGAHAVSA